MRDSSHQYLDFPSGSCNALQRTYQQRDDNDDSDRKHYASIIRMSQSSSQDGQSSSSTFSQEVDTYHVGDTVYCDIEEVCPRAAVIVDIFTSSQPVDLEDNESPEVDVPCITAQLFFWPGAHGLLEQPQRDSLESIVFGVDGDKEDQSEVFYPHIEPLARRGRRSRTIKARTLVDEAANAGIQVSLRSNRLRQKVTVWGDKESFINARSSATSNAKAKLRTDLLCKLAFDSQYGHLWDFKWADVLKTGRENGFWWIPDENTEKDGRLRRMQTPGQTAAVYAKEYWTRHWAAKEPSAFVTPSKKTLQAAKKSPVLRRDRKRQPKIVVSITARQSRRGKHSPMADADSSDVGDSASASEASDFVASDDSSVENEMSSATSAPSDDSDSDNEYASKSLKRRAGPRTPAKRKAIKKYATSTPGKLRAQRMLQVPALPARPPKISSLSSDELAALTPHERAKRLLHVGATPEHLPCREAEFAEILTLVEDSIEEGQGSCVYVAGVPGTGKTATVREVVRTLKRRADDGKLCRFNFVEINGMKLPDPSQAYTELWHSISGQRQPPKAALVALSAHFARKGVGNARPPTVILMDELDQLVTSRQDVMYNMFEWPKQLGSRLIVIAVANTMDLPERVLSARVQSRLGLERVPFEPYSYLQLLKIVHVRLGIAQANGATSTFPRSAAEDMDEDGPTSPERTAAARDRIATAGCDMLFGPSALEFVAKRIANLSGDARRMLDVCRLAIEASEARTLSHQPRGTAADSAAARPIGAPDVANLFKELTKSGTVAHICSLSLHAKLLLFSLLALVRRSGLREAQWDDVLAHHASLCKQNAFMSRSSISATASAVYSPDALAVPLAQLCALGLVTAVGTRCGPARVSGLGRLMLECKESDLRLAFQENKDSRVRNLL